MGHQAQLAHSHLNKQRGCSVNKLYFFSPLVSLVVDLSMT